jgi:hypothetical protein
MSTTRGRKERERGEGERELERLNSTTHGIV